MPNDAKLGLVVGVGVVLSVAMVFFRKAPQGQPPEPIPAAVTSARNPAAKVEHASRPAAPPVAATLTSEPAALAPAPLPSSLPPCFS
jgi:hypothetical protein